ncbi:MAG: hypothetical protein GAK31_03120 [Stenotrophomonas maltophilia]|uniref:Uncharacterized protein n=1 Tax=Stenotrophomonas maltophilia TaxID=40324 RepID=A0A7V8FF18_STEMA|nr:MAG: hypothetical protein GAK31_03120 [Stenotrophomonas maltophilia]
MLSAQALVGYERPAPAQPEQLRERARIAFIESQKAITHTGRKRENIHAPLGYQA